MIRRTQSPKTLRSDARRALETCAGWNLRQTARRVTQFLESEMEESGVSLSQFGLMAEIAAADDDTVSALAQRSMQLQATVQEGSLLLGDATRHISIEPIAWK